MVTRLRSKWFLVLVLAYTVTGCGHSSTYESPATHEAETAVILVPGYYGTRLVRETDHSLVWISAREALFGRRSLALPVPGLGIEADELKPDGILRTIRVVPLFYAVDAYGAILDGLDASFHGRARIVPFAYDWRGDLMEAVRGLGAVVSRLRTEGVRRIAIVAHSMGGLITAYYLRYGTQPPDEAVETWEGAAKLDAVAMAGVPFQGTMTVFRNMQQGVAIGWNRSLLTGTAVSSFPASYFVLPFLKQDELVTTQLQVVGGMIRKAEN